MPPLYAKPQQPQATHQAPEMPEPCPSPRDGSDRSERRASTAHSSVGYDLQQRWYSNVASLSGAQPALLPRKSGSLESLGPDMLEFAYGQLVQSHPYLSVNSTAHDFPAVARPESLGPSASTSPRVVSHNSEGHVNDRNRQINDSNRAVVSSWWSQHQHDKQQQHQPQPAHASLLHTGAGGLSQHRQPVARPSAVAACASARKAADASSRAQRWSISNAAEGFPPPSSLPVHVADPSAGEPRSHDPPSRVASTGHVPTANAPSQTILLHGQGEALAQKRSSTAPPPPRALVNRAGVARQLARGQSDYEAALSSSSYQRSLRAEARQKRLARNAEKAQALQKRREIFGAYSLASQPSSRVRVCDNPEKSIEGGQVAEGVGCVETLGEKMDVAEDSLNTSIVACEITSAKLTNGEENKREASSSHVLHLRPRRTLEEEILQQVRGKPDAAKGKSDFPRAVGAIQRKVQRQERKRQTAAKSREEEQQQQQHQREQRKRHARSEEAIEFEYRPISAYPALAEGRELLRDIEENYPLFKRHLVPPRPLSRPAAPQDQESHKADGAAGKRELVIQSLHSKPPQQHLYHASIPCLSSWNRNAATAEPRASCSASLSSSGAGTALSTAASQQQQHLEKSLAEPKRLYTRRSDAEEAELAAIFGLYPAEGQFALSADEFQELVQRNRRGERRGKQPAPSAVLPTAARNHQPYFGTPHGLSVGEAERRLREAMWRTRLVDASTGTCFSLPPPTGGGGAELERWQTDTTSVSANGIAVHTNPRDSFVRLLKKQPWPFQTKLDNIFRRPLSTARDAVSQAEAGTCNERSPRSSLATSPCESQVGAAFTDFCVAVRAAAAPRPLAQPSTPQRPQLQLQGSISPFSAWSPCHHEDFEGFTPQLKQQQQQQQHGDALNDAELAAVWGTSPRRGEDPYYGPGMPSDLLL